MTFTSWIVAFMTVLAMKWSTSMSIRASTWRRFAQINPHHHQQTTATTVQDDSRSHLGTLRQGSISITVLIRESCPLFETKLPTKRQSITILLDHDPASDDEAEEIGTTLTSEGGTEAELSAHYAEGREECHRSSKRRKDMCVPAERYYYVCTCPVYLVKGPERVCTFFAAVLRWTTSALVQYRLLPSVVV